MRPVIYDDVPATIFPRIEQACKRASRYRDTEFLRPYDVMDSFVMFNPFGAAAAPAAVGLIPRER